MTDSENKEKVTPKSAVDSSPPERYPKGTNHLVIDDTVLLDAGGVAFMTLHGEKTDPDGKKHAVEVNLTSRAKTPVDALVNLIDAVSFAEETYKLYSYPQVKFSNGNPTKDPPPPFEPKYGTPPQQNANQPPPPQGATQASPPQGASNEPYYADVDDGKAIDGIFTIDRLSVEPRPDGKSKLSFFAPGHKWPDIYAIMTPPQLAALMAEVGQWMDTHFTSAVNYDLQQVIKVEWKNSRNVNSKGNPYKDVVRIHY